MYLKDRFNYEYLTLRFGYPSRFAGTNNCGIAKITTTPTNYTQNKLFFNNSIIIIIIVRYTYYIILHSAKVTAMVMDTHHRRSPLVQGGLEIPIQVIVEMDLTDSALRGMRL